MNNTIEWFDPQGSVSLTNLSTLLANQFLDGVGAAA